MKTQLKEALDQKLNDFIAESLNKAQSRLNRGEVVVEEIDELEEELQHGDRVFKKASIFGKKRGTATPVGNTGRVSVKWDDGKTTTHARSELSKVKTDK